MAGSAISSRHTCNDLTWSNGELDRSRKVPLAISPRDRPAVQLWKGRLWRTSPSNHGGGARWLPIPAGVSCRPCVVYGAM
jgi:hypothetical protein